MGEPIGEVTQEEKDAREAALAAMLAYIVAATPRVRKCVYDVDDNYDHVPEELGILLEDLVHEVVIPTQPEEESEQ